MKTTTNLPAKALAITLSIYFLGITACTKDTGIASTNNAQRLVSTPTQSNAANGFTISEKFDVSIPVFIPCANNGNGETVTLNGTLHETFHLTVNKNKFQIKIIDNPQGISGVGDVTGDKYQATGETEEQFGGTFINGQFEDSYVTTLK